MLRPRTIAAYSRIGGAAQSCRMLGTYFTPPPPPLPIEEAKVAVLYQMAPPPPVGGAIKPFKAGGYADSGADIAAALQQSGVKVILPSDSQPAADVEWLFGDNEDGIKAALKRGANVLWANTIVYTGHPIQEAAALATSVGAATPRLVGNSPSLVHVWDDKLAANTKLAKHALRALVGVRLPIAGGVDRIALLVNSTVDKHKLTFPQVLKPIRGRGSAGVAVVHSAAELIQVVAKLAPELGPHFMLEPFLSGDEFTIAIMPPGTYRLPGSDKPAVQPLPWALPPIRRAGHADGVLPSNRAVPVTQNSEALTQSDLAANVQLRDIIDHCEKTAQFMHAQSVIRIDVRADASGVFRMFDVNLKPNMTASSRPGRDGQDGLVTLAAQAFGWSFTDLVRALLGTAHTELY